MSSFLRTKKSKLTIKLLSLFTILIISVAVIMLISVNLLTTRQFKRFILDSDVLIARDYGVLLSKYYELNDQSWRYVDEFIHSIWKDSRDHMNLLMMSYTNHQYMMEEITAPSFGTSQRLVILNKSGMIIADSLDEKKGEIHPADHWINGVTIQLEGDTIGTILYGSMIDPVLNPLDKDFLQSVNLAIFLSALIVVLIAIVVGYYFVSSIVSPLNNLSKAISRIADGELDVQVSVKSEDEINNLANNFNKMSTKLYEAKKWRSQLTADIAHEIRTPITTIQGELEAILDGVYPLEISTIKNIYQDTVILSSIVEDLQLLESLEVSTKLLNLKDENICKILDSVYNSFKNIAHEKKITIVKDYATYIPQIRLDERKIRQVLNNLLSNSIRYSPVDSNIVIAVHVIKSIGKDELIVSVKDSGIGMDKEHLSLIFDRFYRVDTSRSRLSGGTGLGLSISRTIIEAHSGRIEAESKVGHGTIIRCIFDLD